MSIDRASLVCTSDYLSTPPSDGKTAGDDVVGPVCTLDPRPSVMPFRLDPRLRRTETMGHVLFVDVNSDGTAWTSRGNAPDVHWDSFADATATVSTLRGRGGDTPSVRIKVCCVGMSQTLKEARTSKTGEVELPAYGPMPRPDGMSLEKQEVALLANEPSSGPNVIKTFKHEFGIARDLASPSEANADHESSMTLSTQAQFALNASSVASGTECTLALSFPQNEPAATEVDLGHEGGASLLGALDPANDAVVLEDLRMEAARFAARHLITAVDIMHAAAGGDGFEANFYEDVMSQMHDDQDVLRNVRPPRSERQLMHDALHKSCLVVARSFPNRLSYALRHTKLRDILKKQLFTHEPVAAPLVATIDKFDLRLVRERFDNARFERRTADGVARAAAPRAVSASATRLFHRVVADAQSARHDASASMALVPLFPDETTAAGLDGRKLWTDDSARWSL